MRFQRIAVSRIVGAVAAAGLVTAGLVALPATVGAAPAAEADTVSCAQLALGQACTLNYEDHPDATTIELPTSVDRVTVMLAGGSGAPGDDAHAPPGLGAITIATLDVSDVHALDVWLGDQGHGRSGGSGWAKGGDGGDWTAGNGGQGGGGASAVAFSGDGHEFPVIVAGGGGGGGGNGTGIGAVILGGAGGFGGNPAGDAAPGGGKYPGVAGKGGAQPGSQGGDGSDDNRTLPGSGGGGGGGGLFGGTGGGSAYVQYGGYSTGAGGGGGRSAVSVGGTLYGNGAAPIGPGWITILPAVPERFECNGSSEQRDLNVPGDVTAYWIIAAGGAGSPGSNKNHSGHGGLVTGVLDVRDIDTLHYWVGCSGQSAVADWSGHGYGYSGGGGDGGQLAYSGGRGGGATAIGLADGTMLVAAGGGGGTGGDVDLNFFEHCYEPGYAGCGGSGGSGGGSPESAFHADGDEGNGGGGAGGWANSNTFNGQPDPSGAPGGEGGEFDAAGGGGGGGAGYPSGGGGGAHSGSEAGGGGGAGGTYVNSNYVQDGLISTSGEVADATHAGDGFLLMVPIMDPNVDVTVRKVVTGAADGYGQGPFTMTMHCTVGTDTVVDTSFQLDPAGEHVVQAPEGSDCTVTETGTGGASTPAPPQQFTVGSEPSTITMSNAFAATTLDVVVRSTVVDEGGQPVGDVTIEPGSYGVAVSCTLDGHELALPAPVANGSVTIDGDATFTADGVTVSIPGLPVGASCAVAEQPDAGATSAAYTADGSSSGAGEPFTLLADGSMVAIDNTYQLAPLSIPKAAGGDGVIPDGAEFAGTVTCTFNGSPVVFGTPRTFDALTVGGTATVHDLPIGAHCTVAETQTEGAGAVIYSPAATVLIAPQDTAVTITNVYDTGTLLVRATSTGAGLHWANTDLSLHVVCTDQALTVLDDTFTTPPGGGWKSYAVDEGAVCTVTETTTGGATSVAYSSSADGTPSGTPVEVTVGTGQAGLYVDNVFDTGALDVSVTPSGAGVGFADPSTVTVRDCTFNGLPIAIVGGATSVPFGFPAGGGASGIPELVVGAECVVELTDTGGATSATVEVNGGGPTDALSTAATVVQPVTTVAFATVFDLADLDIQKVVTGPGAWASNETFVVEAVCTLDGQPIDQLGPDGHVSLQFAPDGTPIVDRGRVALETMPVGASCDLEETGSGGATSVDIDHDPVLVDPDGSTATVTNTFTVGTVTVSKAVAGNDAAAHADDPFSFEFGCTFNGRRIGSPPTDPQPTTFHLIGGASTTFIDRPTGATCTVNEFETREATSVTPGVLQSATVDGDVALSFTNTFDVATLTVNEVLVGAGAQTYGLPLTFQASARCVFADGTPATLPDGGQVELNEANGFTQDLLVPVGTTCTARQPMFYATSQTVSPPVDILFGDAHTVTITSEYRVGEFTISKNALGNFDEDQEFGFAIECTYAATPPPVNGPLPPGPTPIPLNGNAPNDFELRSGEHRTVSVLSWSTCTTTETSAMGALRIDSVAVGTDAVSGGASASLVVHDGVPGSVTVTNFMPGSLPVTGAELGMLVPVAVVLLLVGVAIVALRRRRFGATRP